MFVIVLLVILIAAATAVWRGGSMRALAATSFRRGPLLLAALILQLGMDLWNPGWLPDAGDLAVLVVTNLAVAVFLIVNRGLPGTRWAAAGMLLNLLVIVANGAMPVSRQSAEIAAMPIHEVGLKHEILTTSTVFPWIADVIPVPLIHRVISAGDLLLATGIFLLVHRRTLGAGAKVRGRGPSG